MPNTIFTGKNRSFYAKIARIRSARVRFVSGGGPAGTPCHGAEFPLAYKDHAHDRQARRHA